MKKISAEIVADSIDSRGNRITSYILTYPRFIHSEMMTHRMFSRNAASSRAIPFAKMVKDVQEEPFIPIAWQKDHKGMQGTEYIVDPIEITNCKEEWEICLENSIDSAETLHGDIAIYDDTPDPYKPLDMGVTKQLCNRLLEPFMWYTNLVTATEYDNFFELRCPKYYYEPENTYFKSKKDFGTKYHECFGSDEFINWDYFKWQSLNSSQAEIHIQALAEAMWDARNESTPNQLKAGEWHIPFGDKFDLDIIESLALHSQSKMIGSARPEWMQKIKLKIATARAARLSYMTFDGEIDYEKDIKLHDDLLASKHASPFEHCARVATDEEYYSNIKGRVPSNQDSWGFFNQEYYPMVTKNGDEQEFKSEELRYGWFNNFRGFIPYRHLINL